ncbi:hypothetical protein HHK36_007841 [Tetracentron sinense]|uniref:NAC domain-containing protein n=1 Tax=Tetracentron sinense TaxID=13715 RepID=A0A834ZEJ6_TETSI|nr:hypothetical protein HHK36_007841 [Tetracentron sinense]
MRGELGSYWELRGATGITLRWWGYEFIGGGHGDTPGISTRVGGAAGGQRGGLEGSAIRELIVPAATNRNQKKLPETRNIQTAAMMGASWPVLSLYFLEALSPEVQSLESHSSNAAIACESTDMNSKNSVSISLSAAPSPERGNFVSLSSVTAGEHSKPALTPPRRLFGHSLNQNHQHYHIPRFLLRHRESGFSTMGGNRGHEFQNQKYSNRRHQQCGFHDWNSSPGFDARENQLYGFTNGPSEFRRHPPLPHSTAIVNPLYNSPPPPVLGHMVPSGYDSDPYFPEACTPSLYCAPVPPPVPQPVPAPLSSSNVEVIRRAPLWILPSLFFSTIVIRPTDSELVVHYLKKKVEDIPLLTNIIEEFNVYSCNPHDLQRIFSSAKEDEFNFFSPRERKLAKESRPIRATYVQREMGLEGQQWYIFAFVAEMKSSREDVCIGFFSSQGEGEDTEKLKISDSVTNHKEYEIIITPEDEPPLKTLLN